MKAILKVIAIAFVLSACSAQGMDAEIMRSGRQTICSLAQSDVGRVVRVSAMFETDRRHGALLSDPGCPSVLVKVGFDAENADSTVANFDQVWREKPAGSGVVTMRVDMTGLVVSDTNTSRLQFRRSHVHSY